MSKLITLNHQEQTTQKIINLLEQLTHNYRQLEQQDITPLLAAFPPRNQELSIIEEIALKTTDLRGYANQIKTLNQI